MQLASLEASTCYRWCGKQERVGSSAVCGICSHGESISAKVKPERAIQPSSSARNTQSGYAEPMEHMCIGGTVEKMRKI